jgi:hypothetical protein
MNSQNPWGETLVTSAGEVPGPGAADFIQVLLDQFLRLGDLLRLETEIRHQLHVPVDPGLCFAGGMLNVEVGPPLVEMTFNAFAIEGSPGARIITTQG